MRTITMAALLAGCLLQSACGNQSPAPAESPKAATGAIPFDTSIDTRQLMSWLIDPSSKVVFGAVATIVTEKGEENVQPHTDEEWNTVRNNAVIVLESGNLLMLEGRARNSQITDVADWNAKARAMSAAARTAIEATDVKDPEGLFTASGDIYQACTDCHAKYIFTPAPDGKQ
ncbi:MAG TPA: cytochrome c [Steroidobacter sp.]